MSEERSRAWRRDKDRVNARKGQGSSVESAWKPEKKWGHLYLRSEKVKRAKQLGFDYPRKCERELLDKEIPLDEK